MPAPDELELQVDHLCVSEAFPWLPKTKFELDRGRGFS
jgi:hypothetical protein